MHGTFVFLMDEIEADSNTSDVESAFEHSFGDSLDENNWYETMAVLFQDGTIWNMSSEGDYRGRDGFVELICESCQDKSKRWEWGLNFAVHCVALDMELRGSNNLGIFQKNTEQEKVRKELNEMSYEEVIEAINSEVPTSLSKAYANVSIPSDEDGFNIEGYSRKKISNGFEIFNDSAVKPFSKYTTSPYEYRCVDLRRESWGTELTSNTVMLFVDIHT